MNFTLLLKNGVALIYDDAKDEFHPVTTDVLIKDGIIESIEPGIVAREGCRVIDCSNKILSPGFVDTHNHHWESPLKGLCENLTALSYFATMFTASTVFSADDVFWATLAGCMQSIDCGTTTCLDYAHMSWSEDHGSQALAGTLSSGIRSVFAYAPAARLKLTEPDVTFKELLPEWFLSSLKNLAALDIFQAPTTRVQLGLGFDFYFLGEKVVKDVFRLARSLDLKLVTSHWANLSGSDDPGLPEVMQNYGLLDDRIVLSHAGGASSKDCDIINKSQKWFVSSSPSVEMTLGLGVPICFENGSVLQDSACSLGVDCHCLSSTSMISEMRVALLAARGLDARHKLRQGKVPSKVCRTAHDAFLMGTIRGARALGMENEIGTIAMGKRADVLIFDAVSPSMSPAAQLDPITAIVMHAGTGDIETVIVDGIVRKRDGRLLPVDLAKWDEKSRQLWQTQQTVTWQDVSSRIADMQSRFATNTKQFSLDKIKAAVAGLYGWSEITS